MKIAFVNNQYQLGGAETVVQQIRQGLSSHNIQSSYWVSEGKFLPENVSSLYPRLLLRLSYTRFHSVVAALFPKKVYTDKAFRRLAHSDADIVHIHNFHGQYASIDALSYLISRKPVVWTFHAFWGITGGCDHPKTCTRYLDACGDCPQLGSWPVGPVDRTAQQLKEKAEILKDKPFYIAAPSKHLASKVKSSRVGMNWDVTNIPNGIDASLFRFEKKHDSAFRQSLGLEPSKRVILIVNRNFKETLKGFPMIKTALASVVGQKGKIQLLLAGVHSDWACRQLENDFCCSSLGYISDRKEMAKIYEVSEYFLFASEAENFPCVILEAMASQCCVVSTPTSGIDEQIQDGETGVIASCLSGESLGQALHLALKYSDDRLKELGQRARTYVQQHFSEEKMVSQYIDLYNRVLKL